MIGRSGVGDVRVGVARHVAVDAAVRGARLPAPGRRHGTALLPLRLRVTFQARGAVVSVPPVRPDVDVGDVAGDAAVALEANQARTGQRAQGRVRRFGLCRLGPVRQLRLKLRTSSRRYRRYGPIRTTGAFLLLTALYALNLPRSTLARLYRRIFTAG